MPDNLASADDADTDLIARRPFVAISPQGERSNIVITVGKPQPYAKNQNWRCPVQLRNHATYVPIQGEDALQALCLGLAFLYSQLQDMQQQGWRLLHPEDDSDIALESTFGISMFHIE